jgi:hypothetical protein
MRAEWGRAAEVAGIEFELSQIGFTSDFDIIRRAILTSP